jgi:hypothetical protein
VLAAAIVVLSIPGVIAAQEAPVISEFMAVNTSDVPLTLGELIDRDGQSSDWIEINNPADSPLNLAGWYLTDDTDDPTKWELPAVEVAPRGYMIVFASGKDLIDPDDELHTNFKLSGAGEFLALVEPDGKTIAHSYDYPQQFAGLSYGCMDDLVASVIPTVLVSEQAEARALIPVDDSLGLDWTG